MNDSRARRLPFWPTAALALAVTALAPYAAAPAVANRLVVAQLAPPVKLRPSTRIAPQPAQQPTAPAATAAEIATPSRATPPPSRATPIEINKLSKVDPNSMGVIEAAHGGFGVDMWEGTARALAAKLLPLLPDRITSPTMQDLMRRLLLSRATAPKGEPKGESLISRRVGRLFAMGDVKSAARLLKSAPSQLVEERLTRVRVESLFFGNDNSGACSQVRSHIQQFQGTYWQQAVAFCLALAGEHGKAAMVADILAEREGAANPSFFTAMEALSGVRNATIESLANPGALQISMLRAANLRLPADVAAADRPSILRAVALSPNAELDLRLDAAERAEQYGVLTVAELGELYAAVPFEKAELDTPLTAAEAKWGPRGRALLLRAAELHDVPTARAEVLKRAYRLGREKGGRDLMRRMSVPVLLTIPPAGELLWFADDAARALFAAGRRDEALAWYRLVRREAGADPEAAAVATALWPLVVLSDVEDSETWSVEELGRWWLAQKGADRDQVSRRARRLFSLFEALDKPIGVGLWVQVMGDARTETTEVPNPALRHALAAASQDLRLGETVTLALIVLGGNGPGGAGPLALEAVLSALRTVGLQQEARSLALEAAIAAGI